MMDADHRSPLQHPLAWLPTTLVLTRLLLGPVLLLLALVRAPNLWFVLPLVLGFLSDIFDGVVARRLGVATERLRVADSWADAAYYGCVAGAAWWLHAPLILSFRWLLAVVLSTLTLSWLVEVWKYGRIASYHAYAAKLWGITLFAASVALLGFGVAGVWLWSAVIVGVLGHLEGVAMTLVLPHWTHDVSGLPEALRLRRRSRDTP